MLRSRLTARWWEATIASLLLLTALTRLPFRSEVPINWDAVQYLLALERFDIALHRPHPPGNPLYVLLGRGANALIPDPNQALIALSIIASLVVVWGTAAIGERLASRRVGAWAALLVAVNPLLWFYGETALSYAPEAAAGVLVALAAWRAYTRPDRWSALWLGLTTAFTGGLRPTALPLLGLVWLFGVWTMRWRVRALAAGVTAAGCLAWAVPLVVVSGGPVEYWTQLRLLTRIAVEPTSLASGPSMRWLGNLWSVVSASAVMLNLFAVVVAVAVVRARPSLRPLSPRACLLWAWLIPPVLMFTLVHFGQWGYLLLILPPVTILGLLALERAEMLHGRVAAARLVALALVGALSFLLMPSVRMPGHEMQPSRGALAAHNEAWREVTRIVSELPPDRTVVLTSSDGRQSFRIAGYLLPQYSVVGVGRDWHGNWGSLYDAIDGQSDYRLDPTLYAHALVRVTDLEYIVVLDNSLAERVPDAITWSRWDLPDGRPLLVHRSPPGTTYLSFADRKIRVLHENAFRSPSFRDRPPAQP